MTQSERLANYEAMQSFIVTWWQSNSIYDVCARTGMERRDASNLAAGLRRHGIPMKSMKFPPKTYKQGHLFASDYKRLAKMAEELQEQHETEERTRQMDREAAEIQRKYRTVTG